MVYMAVCDNDCRDRLVAQVLASEGNGCCRRFAAIKCIDHDPSGTAFDQGHIGYIEAAKLVDTFRHLEQANLGVENGVPPEAWVDCRWRLALDKLEVVKIDQHVTRRGGDFSAGLGNKAALGILEILGVVEF